MVYPIFYLLVVVVGWVAGLCRGPFWAVLTYVFVYFNIPSHQWWAASVPSLRWSFLSAGIVLVSCVIHKDQLKNGMNAPLKALIFLLVLMICIIPLAYNADRSLVRIYDFFRYVLFFYLMCRVIKTFAQYRWFVLAILFHCFFLSLLARHYFSGIRLDGVGLPDASDANMLAALVVLVLPFLVVFLFFGSRFEKVAAFLFTPFILNMFAMTRSRGGFLGLLVAAGVFAWGARRDVDIKKMVLGFVAAAVVVLGVMDKGYVTRVTRLFGGEENIEDQSAGRTDIWKYGLRMTKDYPLGCGGGGFSLLSTAYLPDHLIEKTVGRRASHNTYVLVVTEQGVLGLGIYLVFILLLFKGTRRARSSLHGITGMDKGLWNHMLAHTYALETGLAGFFTASIFIDRLYFECIYLIAALVPVLAAVAEAAQGTEGTEGVQP
ncbi:O-antigen ligase family protein [Desulfoluna spongiiphila]|uniref:O-antigen ligase family protein n=1 Tax=Desulfoluna spongiiphila TaxID=419481 RepID=UPI001257F2BD|nr:O-antigen ligase family protein [Desulfoluna spongiiphila]VVS94003.1 o-antigen ligase-related [Desulfoluna spongiiphila]